MSDHNAAAGDTSDVLVVGSDGSATADRAIAEAIRLAQALGASLHLVSAYVPDRSHVAGAPKAAAEIWRPLPDGKVETILATAEVTARSSGIPVTTHALRRDPSEALLEVAEETGATMIIVGSRGMTGVRRALGSVPNTISHRARCSVLIVSTDE